MPPINSSTSQLDDLKRRLEEIHTLHTRTLAEPEDTVAFEKLKKTATTVVRQLEGLSPQERSQLPLSEDDKKRLQQLAGLSFIAPDKRDIIAQTLGLDAEDAVRRGEFIRNKSKQGPDAGAAATSGPLGLQAVLAGVAAADPGATVRPLNKSELAERQSNSTYQAVLRVVDKMSEGANFDGAIKQRQDLITALQGKLTRVPESEREEIRKTIAQAQAEVTQLQGMGWKVGPEVAGLTKDRYFEDVMAFYFGLPHRLSDKQVAYLKGQGAGDPTGIAALGIPALTAIAQHRADGNADAAAAQVAKLLGLSADDVSPSAAKTAAATNSLGLPEDVQKNLDKLRENPETRPQWEVLTNYHEQRNTYHNKARKTYNEIMGLLRSGMPIEMVIMLVMLLLTERQEEKFNLKVQEFTASEQIDKMNEPIQQKINALVNSNDPHKLAMIDELEHMKVKPAAYGLAAKSTTIIMQELQVEMQMYMQVMQALSAVIRQVQDLILTPIRNIR